MTFTPEDRETLRKKEQANCIRKLHAGKTLTRDERRMLDELSDSQPAAGLQTVVNFAANWDELAQRLGVSRRSILKWREREDLAAMLPRPRADGRHDIAAWQRAMVEHGLAGADEFADIGSGVTPEDDGAPKNLRDWKVEREKRIVRKLDIDIDVLERTLLVAAGLEVALGATFAAIQTKLSQFPARAARFLVGIRDEAVAEEKLRDEMDAVLTDLHSASYIDDAIAGVFGEPGNANLPIGSSENTPNIEALVRAVLARIGRRVISEAGQGSGALETEAGMDPDPLPAAAAHGASPPPLPSPAPPATHLPAVSPKRTASSRPRSRAPGKAPAVPGQEVLSLSKDRPARAKVPKGAPRRKRGKNADESAKAENSTP